MTSEQYSEIFNRMKFNMLSSLPGGKLPENEADRETALIALRAHRKTLEELALVKKIEGFACYSLEGEILSDADEVTIKALRKREREGDGASRVSFNRDKRLDAKAKLIELGFSEEQASLMIKNTQAGALRE